MNDMLKARDWIVRIYRADKVVLYWVIKDRTEREAEKEAMGDPRMRIHEGYANFDWTLSPDV